MKTVDEFKGMKPEDVVKYIEGEPSISVVPVEPGLANMEKTDATGPVSYTHLDVYKRQC